MYPSQIMDVYKEIMFKDIDKRIGNNVLAFDPESVKNLVEQAFNYAKKAVASSEIFFTIENCSGEEKVIQNTKTSFYKFMDKVEDKFLLIVHIHSDNVSPNEEFEQLVSSLQEMAERIKNCSGVLIMLNPRDKITLLMAKVADVNTMGDLMPLSDEEISDLRDEYERIYSSS